LDNQSTDEPPGVVRAFDTRTGALLWAWEVLEPESRGSLGPGERYARNTANAWTVFSADIDNGLVFVPTGGPPPDFFRFVTANQEASRIASSSVALLVYAFSWRRPSGLCDVPDDQQDGRPGSPQ